MQYVITSLGSDHISRTDVEGEYPIDALYNFLMDVYSAYLDEYEGDELDVEIASIRKHSESGKVVGPGYYVQDHDDLGFYIVELVK